MIDDKISLIPGGFMKKCFTIVTYLCGLLLFTGVCFAEDNVSSRANEYFLKGVIQYLDQDTENNKEKAKENFKLAADLGHKQGIIQYSLSLIKTAKSNKDYVESREWLTKAAYLGSDWAQFELGEIYLKGLSVPLDYSKAAMWFYISSENGNNLAAVSYAGISNDLSKIEKDKIIFNADKWFSK